jgi:hypothetical protein
MICEAACQFIIRFRTCVCKKEVMKEQIERFWRESKLLLIFFASFAMCGVPNVLCADSASRTNSPQENLPQVKTIFEEDAKLTEQEVKDVLSLARQCGINQPTEVRTVHILPSGGKDVLVKSVELFKGADITFDEISITKSGWTHSEPGKEAKQIGNFWAEPSDKSTTHLRVYDFRGEKIRVGIGTGITTELADKIIPLIAAKKVTYSDNKSIDYERDEMERMIDSKPSGISKAWESPQIRAANCGCNSMD